MSALKDRILLATAPWLAFRLTRWIMRTLKPEYLADEEVHQIWSEGRQIILAFWHDQLLMIVPGYPGPAIKGLVSSSKDGELIARVMKYFGYDAVRGSSSRGGTAAFRELVKLSRESFDLGITPDGPRGPRHQVKEGVVQLARLTGRPVVPMSFCCSHGHRFSSWDRFLLPYPWGKAVFRFGEALYYDRGEAPEDFQDRLKRALDENTRIAGEYLKQHGLSAV